MSTILKVMIQRIQSLFLLIALLLSAGYFLFPFSVKIFNTGQGEAIYKLMIQGVINPDGSKSPVYLLLILCILIIVLITAAIFLYSNRKLQIKICWLAVIPCLAVIAADYFLSDSMGKELGIKNPVYHLASYIPVIQFILLRLAIKAIQRDEELIRSADRIR